MTSTTVPAKVTIEQPDKEDYDALAALHTDIEFHEDILERIVEEGEDVSDFEGEIKDLLKAMHKASGDGAMLRILLSGRLKALEVAA